MVLFSTFYVVVYSYRNRFRDARNLQRENDRGGQERGADPAPTNGNQGLEFSRLMREVLAASDHVEGVL
jgi:hypothetical protein